MRSRSPRPAAARRSFISTASPTCMARRRRSCRSTMRSPSAVPRGRAGASLLRRLGRGRGHRDDRRSRLPLCRDDGCARPRQGRHRRRLRRRLDRRRARGAPSRARRRTGAHRRLGLVVADSPIGDLFWEAQPRNGNDYSGLRRLLFARDDAAEASRTVPRRPQRYGARAAALQDDALRLAHRLQPALFLRPPSAAAPPSLSAGRRCCCGARTTAWCRAPMPRPMQGPRRAELRVIAGAGHSPQVERPAETAALINTFLRPPAATRKAAAKAKAVAAAPKAKAKATAKAKAKAKPKAKARASVLRGRKSVSAKTGQRKRLRR